MSSNNRLLSIYTCQYIYTNQGGIIISNYDIFLLQFLFCKNTVNLKECLAAFALLFCYSSNGWLQLELLNTLILNTFEKIDECKCLFQRNTATLKILGHCKGSSVIMMYHSNVWLQVLL